MTGGTIRAVIDRAYGRSDEKGFTRNFVWHVEDFSVTIKKSRIESPRAKVIRGDNAPKKFDIVADAEQNEILQGAFHSIDCSASRRRPHNQFSQQRIEVVADHRPAAYAGIEANAGPGWRFEHFNHTRIRAKVFLWNLGIDAAFEGVARLV